MFEIESSVEVRPRGKYPFTRMEVGESVFIAGETTKPGGAYTAAQVMGLSKGWKFTGRKVEGGIRIWRVE